VLFWYFQLLVSMGQRYSAYSALTVRNVVSERGSVGFNIPVNYI